MVAQVALRWCVIASATVESYLSRAIEMGMSLQRAAEVRAQAVPSAQPTVLIVDDEPLTVVTISHALRAAGFQTMDVTSGSMALERCRDRPPDIAILDYKMPDVSGVEIARILSGAHQFPIIFLSAFGDDSSVQTAAEAGAAAYFVKPIDPLSLVATVRAVLKRFPEIQTLRLESSHMISTLQSTRHINLAVGLLMEQLHLPEKYAYDRLRSYARRQNKKIADVACEFLAATSQTKQLVMQITEVPEKSPRIQPAKQGRSGAGQSANGATDHEPKL